MSSGVGRSGSWRSGTTTDRSKRACSFAAWSTWACRRRSTKTDALTPSTIAVRATTATSAAVSRARTPPSHDTVVAALPTGLVARAAHREDQLRCRGIGLDLGPQAPDRHVHEPRI